MKLFTKSIDKKLFAQYPKGGNLEGQKVIAKIFNPYGRGRWYVLNSDPEDPDYLWGIVELFEGEPEVGSFSRSELENIKVGAYKLSLERDLYFDEINAMELYRGLKSGDKYAKGGKLKVLKNKDIEEGNYFHRRYKGAIGSFAWKSDNTKYHEGVLYPLDEFDVDLYKHLPLKMGEVLFRYKTEIMGDMSFPLIKINLDKLLVYFLEDAEDENNPKFYSKGTPLQYLTIEEYYFDVREFAQGGQIEAIVLNEGNGKILNELFHEWRNIKTPIQHKKWSDKVAKTRFGTYDNMTLEDVMEKFEFNQSSVNSTQKKDFKNEVRQALSEGGLYAKGGKLDYTPKRKISNATIRYEGKEYLVSGDDMITGAYKLEKGGLSDNYVYIPKRDVVKITTTEGEDLKNNVNGVWVKKTYFASKDSKKEGNYEPSQATKVLAYKLTELAKDKDLTASQKDSMVESLSMVEDFVSDLKYEIESNISGLAIETYANAVKFVSKKNKPNVAKDLTIYNNSNAIKLFPERFITTPLLSKKAVSIKGNVLDNTTLLKELDKFTSDDKYRPAMTAVHFDGNDVVATNANVLIHLRNNVSVEKQSVCVSKVCKESVPSSQGYPDWKRIIAQDLNDSKYQSQTFDLDNLIVLATWINNYYSVTENAIRQVTISTKNGDITFNPELLLKTLNMLKVLGVKNPIMYYEKPHRAVYFGEDGMLKKNPLNHNFVLLMPLLSVNASTFSLNISKNNYEIVVSDSTYAKYTYAKGGEMGKVQQLELFAKGGTTFDDKVRAIKRNLVGKKVPSKYKGEYGNTYDKKEAEESARRIAGSMMKK